ncbi:MAG: B12-binding domain-containing radical SAM protein [Burkholderiales bacterium]
MTLGILRVAAVLENAGHAVEILDLSGVANYQEAVADHAAVTEAMVFGLTATTPQLPAAIEIAEAIRKHKPDARLILGGPHITLVNAACKKSITRAMKAFQDLFGYFDLFVAGDGEQAIFQALDHMGMGRLIDADDPKSKMFLTNQTLSELPLPARHLVDVNSYHYEIEGARATSLIAQLGCPFGCGFCGGRMSPTFRKIRMRSVESIIAELRYLHKTYGFTAFMFYDDELNVNPQMVTLMRMIERLATDLKVELKLRGFVKAELFDDEQAEAMYRAGFRWILTGFESGSPRILKNIQKRATREDNTRAVEIAHRNGLKVKALMSLGHPGESVETIQETKNWLLENKPEDFDATVITTYPGTPYYDDAEEIEPGVWKYAINGDALYGLEVDYTQVADYYKGDPNDGYKAYVYTDFLTPDNLVRERNALEAEVREKLNIPFNPSLPAQRYEHTMGQLPASILKRSAPMVDPFRILQ